MNIAAEVEAYKDKLEEFMLRNKLPRHWFELPDHIALKAFNPGNYKNGIEQFTPISESIYEAQLSGRRIAYARLLGRYAIDMSISFTSVQRGVQWVEIIESKPEDQSEEATRLDHVEMYFPRGIIPIRSVLRRKKITIFDQENPSHSWVSVIIDNDANELKFTDKSLEETVEEGFGAGGIKKIV